MSKTGNIIYQIIHSISCNWSLLFKIPVVWFRFTNVNYFIYLSSTIAFKSRFFIKLIAKFNSIFVNIIWLSFHFCFFFFKFESKQFLLYSKTKLFETKSKIEKKNVAFNNSNKYLINNQKIIKKKKINVNFQLFTNIIVIS